MDIIDKAKLSQKQEIQIANTSKNNDDLYNDLNLNHWPEPPSNEVFNGLAGEIVRLIEPNSEADPIALLTNLLVAIGNIIGRNAFFKVESDIHFMNLFAVLVGETSKARKGTSWNYIKNLIVELDSSWESQIQSGLSSGEGLIWAVRDGVSKEKFNKDHEVEIEMIDSGVDDKRLLIIESEFASTLRVLGREGNTLSPLIRNAWDTGTLQTLTKNSAARATDAHISILGHITKDELRRYMSTVESANGFGNRHLWICVKRSKNLPFGGNINKVDFHLINKKLTEVFQFGKNAGEITWSDQSKPIWEKAYPSLSEGKPGLVGSMTGRAEAYVTRLACIYALLDLSTTINPSHLESALAYWNYAENSTKYIFGELTGNDLADEITEALEKNPDGMTRTDINNYFGRHKNSIALSEAINVLIGIGRIKSTTILTKGRKIERFDLTKSLNHSNSQNSHNSRIKSQDETNLTTPISNL